MESTVDLYLDENPEDSLPLLAMLRTSEAELLRRAERLITSLSGLALSSPVGKGQAQVGGGSLPRSVIASVTVDLRPVNGSPTQLARRLRTGSPPILGYLSGGCFRIDLRTVFPGQDKALVDAIIAAMG